MKDVLFYDYYKYEGQVPNGSSMWMIEVDYFKELMCACPIGIMGSQLRVAQVSIEVT